MSTVDDDERAKKITEEVLAKLKERFGDESLLEEEPLTHEEQVEHFRQKLHPYRHLFSFFRFLTAGLLFHQQLGFQLTGLLRAWAYFFIGVNVFLLSLMAVLYILLFWLILKPQVSAMMTREKLEGLVNNTIEADPFHHYLMVPMIAGGIYCFGWPAMAMIYVVAYITERMAQHQFACVVAKFDNDDEDG
jgi:hypothetical protein